MIRTVQLSEITENIKEMCIEANHFLSPDMAEAMKQAQQNEKSKRTNIRVLSLRHFRN